MDPTLGTRRKTTVFDTRNSVNPRINSVTKVHFRQADVRTPNRGSPSQHVHVRSVTERGECSRGSWKIRKLKYRRMKGKKERETRGRAVDFRMKLKNKLSADDIDSWIPVERELDLGAGRGCCRKGNDNSGQWIRVHHSRGWVHCYYMTYTAPMYTRPFAVLPFGSPNLEMDGVEVENGGGDLVTGHFNQDSGSHVDLQFRTNGDDRGEAIGPDWSETSSHGLLTNAIRNAEALLRKQIHKERRMKEILSPCDGKDMLCCGDKRLSEGPKSKQEVRGRDPVIYDLRRELASSTVTVNDSTEKLNLLSAQHFVMTGGVGEKNEELDLVRNAAETKEHQLGHPLAIARTQQQELLTSLEKEAYRRPQELDKVVTANALRVDEIDSSRIQVAENGLLRNRVQDLEEQLQVSRNLFEREPELRAREAVSLKASIEKMEEEINVLKVRLQCNRGANELLLRTEIKPLQSAVQKLSSLQEDVQNNLDAAIQVLGGSHDEDHWTRFCDKLQNFKAEFHCVQKLSTDMVHRVARAAELICEQKNEFGAEKTSKHCPSEANLEVRRPDNADGNAGSHSLPSDSEKDMNNLISWSLLKRKRSKLQSVVVKRLKR